MQYRVLIDFSDRVFGGAYAAGDLYPKAGITPSKDWLETLLGNGNRFGRPVLEALELDEPEAEGTPDGEPDDLTEEALAKLTIPELKELAEKLGVDCSKATRKADYITLLLSAEAAE